MLFQRIWVQFLALTWHPKIGLKFSSWGPTPSLNSWGTKYTDIYADIQEKILIYIK